MIEGGDNNIIKQVFNEILGLGIEKIEYDKNIKLDNMSEYEFELVKIKAILQSKEEVEVYLKMIKKSRIKESIFCYWCTIYEEELAKSKELENIDIFINKVLISELEKDKYQKRIFLTIEDNQTSILETGTEVNFVEIIDYIDEHKNQKNQYEKLYEYFDNKSDDVLMIGVKMNRMKR